MMQLIRYPQKTEWDGLCERPEFQKEDLSKSVASILSQVKEGGDVALMNLTERYDKIRLDQLSISEQEWQSVALDRELEEAILLAKANIERFHRSQQITEPQVETMPGVRCWRKSIAIDKVGIYIPGGTAPLFSTVLMLGVPATLAGCKQIVLCTPPDPEGKIHPAILFTASILGIDKVFKVGGAQAIAAMTYGTETIPKVHKIFGPGNQYVTKAKQMAQEDGLAIDMPAGPSEVLVIADEHADASYVAADLLSQAEHGDDSQVILLSDSESLIQGVLKALEMQLPLLPRKEMAEKALQNSRAILLADMDEVVAFSNSYAPEHLIVVTERNDAIVNAITNAGSVFIGPYSCESAGDYASGTNHTLPTNGYARAYSGVSVDSFVKKITYQEISAEGMRKLGPSIQKMAEAELLFAHKNAVTLRLKDLGHV
jgi:histidinol dehydrogenase